VAEIDDVYNSADEQERLAAILEQRYLTMLNAVHTAMLELFGLDPERFIVTDAAVNQLLVEAAHQVVRIDETTRQAIAEQLRVGQALGFSNYDIAHGKPEVGYRGIDGLFQETWKGRAEMVARTELQHAQNEAAINRYQATGMVDMLRIIDGDDWDTPCANRNGTVVPISERPTLNHPNCTLVVVPVLREGVA
jgi:hypothetical protein